MRDMYIQNAHGLVLVYSIASQTSFQELMEIREQILSIKGTLDVPLILVGNKCDLEVERCIWTSQGLDLSKHFNDCVYIEASAKQRINVDEVCPSYFRAHGIFLIQWVFFLYRFFMS